MPAKIRDNKAKLLREFNSLLRSPDRQERGYALERFLEPLFAIEDIPVLRSFRRNAGGEQIDGAFKLEGWHYLLECRWREQPANIRDLDGLLAQIGRSGRQMMGLFLSVNGWSQHVSGLLKQNPSKAIFLMDGDDLQCVLARRIQLSELLLAKIAKLNLECEPYLSARDVISVRRSL